MQRKLQLFKRRKSCRPQSQSLNHRQNRNLLSGQSLQTKRLRFQAIDSFARIHVCGSTLVIPFGAWRGVRRTTSRQAVGAVDR